MHCSAKAENGSHPYLDQHGYSSAPNSLRIFVRSAEISFDVPSNRMTMFFDMKSPRECDIENIIQPVAFQ